DKAIGVDSIDRIAIGGALGLGGGERDRWPGARLGRLRRRWYLGVCKDHHAFWLHILWNRQRLAGRGLGNSRRLGSSRRLRRNRNRAFGLGSARLFGSGRRFLFA